MVALHEKKGTARRRVDAGLNLINGEWERIKKVETDGRCAVVMFRRVCPRGLFPNCVQSGFCLSESVIHDP